MAEARLLKLSDAGLSEFSATDTLPVSNVPGASIISATVSASQDDYSPTGWADADVVRLSFSSVGLEITGFAAWTNTRQKRIVNTSSNFAVIPSGHTDSSAANRVAGPMDHILEAYGIMIIEYDDTSDRVRVVTNSFNPAALMGAGRGFFYYASPGATLGSDWGLIGFGISGGNNGTVEGTSTLPGGWEINTSTSATGASSLFLPKTQTTILTWNSPCIKVSACWVYFATISDGTQSYTFQTGMTNSSSGLVLAVNNSVNIRYSHSINSGKFEGVVRNSSGTETTVDLGVTVAANTPYTLVVVHNATNTEARFYVDGVLCGIVQSGMPLGTATMADRTLIIKTAGTTSRNAVIAAKTFFTTY